MTAMVGLIGKVGKFEKISENQWVKDCGKDNAEVLNEVVKLPKRATANSCGYDFVSPESFTLEPGETYKIPTGIKCKISEGYFLAIYPRSSLGFKYQLNLCNSVGIIDADYYNNADNEGHIWIKFVNKGNEPVSINAGDKVAQGIFTQYFITEDDEATGERSGGLGSTGK